MQANNKKLKFTMALVVALSVSLIEPSYADDNIDQENSYVFEETSKQKVNYNEQKDNLPENNEIKSENKEDEVKTDESKENVEESKNQNESKEIGDALDKQVEEKLQEEDPSNNESKKEENKETDSSKKENLENENLQLADIEEKQVLKSPKETRSSVPSVQGAYVLTDNNNPDKTKAFNNFKDLRNELLNLNKYKTYTLTLNKDIEISDDDLPNNLYEYDYLFKIQGGKLTVKSDSDDPNQKRKIIFKRKDQNKTHNHYPYSIFGVEGSSSILTLDNIVLNGGDIVGGVTAKKLAVLNVRNSIIENCYGSEGGAISLFDQSEKNWNRNRTIANITNSTIQNCLAPAGGGAIRARNNTLINAKKTKFLNNDTKTGGGGGILLDDIGRDSQPSNATAVIDECEFTGNKVAAIESRAALDDYDIRRLKVNYNIDTKATVNVKNSTFNENVGKWGGGAIFMHDGNLDVDNSIFDKNKSEILVGPNDQKYPHEGGAIFINHNYEGKINKSTFTNNICEGSDGGAIASRGSLELTNSTFKNNKADGDGGAVYVSVGAEKNGVKVDAKINIDNITVENNISEKRGGGLYLGLDALYYNAGRGSFSSRQNTIKNSTIINNSAKTGGGIYLNEIGADIEKTKISNNTYTENGGGIYANIQRRFGANSTNDIKIKDSEILNNTKKDGAYTEGINGGGVYLSHADMESTNTKIEDNKAYNGAGVYVRTNSKLNSIGSSFKNNIASRDGGAIYTEKHSYNGNGDRKDGYKYAPSPTEHYTNVKVDENTEFSGNKAIKYYKQPYNFADFKDIKSKSISEVDGQNPEHIIDNYDINFRVYPKVIFNVNDPKQHFQIYGAKKPILDEGDKLGDKNIVNKKDLSYITDKVLLGWSTDPNAKATDPLINGDTPIFRQDIGGGKDTDEITLYAVWQTKAKIVYDFKSKDGTELPTEVKNLKPADQEIKFGEDFDPNSGLTKSFEFTDANGRKVRWFISELNPKSSLKLNTTDHADGLTISAIWDHEYTDAKVEFEFKSADQSLTLPDEVTKLRPENKNYEYGTTIDPNTLVTTKEVEQTINGRKGKWTLTNWTPGATTLDKETHKDGLKFTATWTFAYTEKTAEKVQPEYTGADAQVGKPTTITAPNFTDKDGKDTTKPDGTKFALGKDAPKGAEIDENTGKITYTPTEDKAGQDVKIPVVVTYKDGSKDDVKATVTVAKKEVTRWVLKKADGKYADLKHQEDGKKIDNDNKSDIDGYYLDKTVTEETDTTITYINIYKVQLATVAKGLDGKELKAATIGYKKENPDKFEGYTYLFDEGENKVSEVQGKKAYLVNRIYAKNPEVVEVANPNSLTADEQKAVKDAVKKANKDLLDNQISVNNKGEVTITRGKQTAKLNPSLTVKEKAPVAKPEAPSLKANDDGSVTVTPPADKDVDVVQITYTDEKDHEGTLVATKDKDGNWKLPDGTDPSITIDPTTGVVTIPANQVKDGSEVKAIAEKGGTHSDEAKVNAKNNPVTKKEITKWVQETADGRTVELKKQDGAHPDNDGVSDIEGYEFVRTDKTEDDTTITYTNVYKLLLGSKAVGLDGKELKAATIGYVKENPEEFTGYTFLFDEAGNTPSDVEGKKVYVVNRIYAKNPEVVEVANPDSLTEDEQNKVKEAVKTANPDLLDNQISVNEKGEVTITRGNQTATLDPSLTVVKQGQTTAPKITQPKAGDKKITGTAEPGAKVEVELPDGTKVETTADQEGNWTAEVPEDKEPKEGETVKAVATVDGKTPSDEATATTGKADEEKTETPTINPVKVGDKNITGTAKPNAIVNVFYPNGDESETTADEQGNWSVDAPDGLAEGQTIRATATEGLKAPSDAAETVVKGKGTKVGGDVKPVKPTDDKQDTGIKVENPDDDTKVTAKDEDGKDVPVEIDKDGNVIVTPGKNVDGPITVTIEAPDLPGGKVEIEVPVVGHEKGKDDNISDKDDNKTIADKTNPTVPSKTEVKDKNNLTDEEKDKVKKAIEDANKDKFPQGTKVEIGKDGTAKITYPDGSVDIIKGNDLVIQKANAGASGSINRVNSSNTGKNVKTGVGSSATILATLAAAVSGLFASKKRKND